MKTIAVFCGGGIRGYTEAKFCELLGLKADLYAGTSIGGLIACARASGRSWPDVVGLFTVYGETIFKKKFTNRFNLIRKGYRYSNVGLTKALKRFFGEIRMTELSPVCVTALGIGKDNYGPHYFSEVCGDRVIDVCLATSAAPSYFPPYQNFVDGGLFMNNPVIYAVMRAKKVWPNEKFHVINIGSGDDPVKFGPPKNGFDLVGNVIQNCLNGNELAAKELMIKFPMACVSKYEYHDFTYSRPIVMDDTDNVSFEVMRRAAYAEYVCTTNR